MSSGRTGSGPEAAPHFKSSIKLTPVMLPLGRAMLEGVFNSSKPKTKLGSVRMSATFIDGLTAAMRFVLADCRARSCRIPGASIAAVRKKSRRLMRVSKRPGSAYSFRGCAPRSIENRIWEQERIVVPRRCHVPQASCDLEGRYIDVGPPCPLVSMTMEFLMVLPA